MIVSKSVTVPVYNFSTHSREETTTTIYGANVIIFEGILALYDKRIRDMMDMRVSFFLFLFLHELQKQPNDLYHVDFC